jgi:hypothetical protein
MCCIHAGSLHVKLGFRCEENTETNFRCIGWEDGEWSELAQDGDGSSDSVQSYRCIGHLSNCSADS